MGSDTVVMDKSRRGVGGGEWCGKKDSRLGQSRGACLCAGVDVGVAAAGSGWSVLRKEGLRQRAVQVQGSGRGKSAPWQLSAA